MTRLRKIMIDRTAASCYSAVTLWLTAPVNREAAVRLASCQIAEYQFEQTYNEREVAVSLIRATHDELPETPIATATVDLWTGGPFSGFASPSPAIPVLSMARRSRRTRGTLSPLPKTKPYGCGSRPMGWNHTRTESVEWMTPGLETAARGTMSRIVLA